VAAGERALHDEVRTDVGQLELVGDGAKSRISSALSASIASWGRRTAWRSGRVSASVISRAICRAAAN
jgi:hypothetical protein